MTNTDNLEKLLAKGMDSALLRFGLGSAYFNTGNYTEAVEHLQRCIALDSDYTAAFKLLGKALYHQQQWQAAVDVFSQGCESALQNGDKQAEKEMQVFTQKIKRRLSKH
ncbi:MAG: tetratricopeptide repeat protein [Gammaproteobacteria bacterium]|jgi:tetratricopeptide (TPR) repeat protein|nr:tetratricopeptide repeat protein [Gammaproteobacteria bacterium]MBT5202051.1 tetratricopeptide repeat protein [Gammaproteobacteria bacterium]MBT5603057.1 tetratricopeptide repeat protein [Gammaproteobacteria bacterium]MBT6245335.1 tetratricopeptide repeat protein [Gammaproteobacteria bacterium]